MLKNGMRRPGLGSCSLRQKRLAGSCELSDKLSVTLNSEKSVSS
jgi:hypothetical protein